MELLKNLEGMSADEQMSAVVELQKAAMKTLEEQKQVSIGKSAEMVVQGLKKIKSDFEAKFDSLNYDIQTKVANLKDGQQGIQGQKGEQGDRGLDGAQGRDGRNGLDGKNGVDGEDGVSVEDAKIDFDGSLIITLSTGKEMNVGEVVAPDLAERIKVISTMSTNTAIANITSGTIDGTVIGGSTPAAGTFTTVNATTVDATNVEVTNIKAKDGTASISLADTTGIATFSKATVISTSDTTAALRVTQLGTGNALLVEDSTNPDATPFVIDNAGQVLSGYTATVSPTAQGRIEASLVGSTSPIFVARQGSNSAKGAELMLLHARAGAGTNTSVTTGDATGEITFWGADGTNFVESASIEAFVDGAPGTSDMPGRLVFSTTADGASSPTERVRITSTGKTGFATLAPAATVHVAGDTILSNVNVIGASYDSVSFSVAGEELTPTDLFFSPDGLKMYVIGSTGDDVNEYNLSTAWVVSSAVYSTVFSVSSQDLTPQGLFFRADGTKMYVLGATNDTVFQYTLGTPWSVATASYDSISFSVAVQETTPTGIFFKPNGLTMYVVGNANDAVYQYTLSTAWNVSTATFLQSFSISGQEVTSTGMAFTGDGSRMFITGSTGDDVNVYNLTTPWDISTSAFVNVFSVAGQDTSPGGLYIKPNGTKMYIVGSTNDTVFQYTVPSIDIQLTGQTSVAALEVQQDLNIYGKLGAYSISASNVGVGTSSPSASAILDAQSTTKGVRMPNMTTTQKNAIASPAAGLMVFDTTLAKLSVYSGVAWETITSI